MTHAAAAEFTLSTIFKELESLQALALEAGETQLAADLNVALAAALYRQLDAVAGTGREDSGDVRAA